MADEDDVPVAVRLLLDSRRLECAFGGTMESRPDTTNLGKDNKAVFDPGELRKTESVWRTLATLEFGEAGALLKEGFKGFVQIAQCLLQELRLTVFEPREVTSQGGQFLAEGLRINASASRLVDISLAGECPVPDPSAASREVNKGLFLFASRLDSELVGLLHDHATLYPMQTPVRTAEEVVLRTTRYSSPPTRRWGYLAQFPV